MPEFPWVKWFYNDWLADPALHQCSPASRGIWIEALCVMMSTGTDRVLGTDTQLARQLRCTEDEVRTAHAEFSDAKACATSMQNGCKIWVCRKRERELRISALRSRSASSRWSKVDANTLQHVDAKPMQPSRARVCAASAYASDSASGSESPLGKSENPLPVNGSKYHADARTALHILNEASGRHFRETDENLSFISARLREPEVTLEGVRTMIARQVKRWAGTDKSEYLRPQTLFNATKFDSYYAAKDAPIFTNENPRHTPEANQIQEHIELKTLKI